jgi:hypothetical protein
MKPHCWLLLGLWKLVSVFWQMPCLRLYELTLGFRNLIPLTGKPVWHKNASENAASTCRTSLPGVLPSLRSWIRPAFGQKQCHG